MRLSTFAALPRRVALAGIPMVVHRLRLIDLASIESWMAEVIPRPRPGEDDIPGGWPPTFDTEAGISLVSCGEGVAQLVFFSLRRTLADLTIEQAREIASSIRDEEFGPFYSAIFPEPDDDPTPAPADRPRVNWHARINTLASTYKYTPDQILDLPLDQFFALGREPENEKAANNWEVPIGSPADLDRLWAERQAKSRGDDGRPTTQSS